ncbi:MAG: RluA family pseudouridine synthase [Deltaproteobacteria bacterium]|nr:RluA family pseudouridine synthase [Deltaproteobacteria bacterium]
MTPPVWQVAADDDGVRLARYVSDRSDAAFNQVKRWVGQGKVLVDGSAVTNPGARLLAGQTVTLRMNAPRARDRSLDVDIVFEDAHVVVIDKPAGISSVPYEKGERGTAMDAIRDAWKAQGKKSRGVPIHVVHRIDKATSGLLMFAKSKKAELGLAKQLREHALEREYRCVVHGQLDSRRIESQLVRDRGDGLRGSDRRGTRGKRAVTHVEALDKLAGATACAVRLETGRTHQIRIHLAEAGHPLVGEKVYIRNYGGPVIESPRLLLHAYSLGFEHPITGKQVSLRREPPKSFMAVVESLSDR